MAVPGGSEPSAASATLEVNVHGVRSGKGTLRLIVCPPGAGFPDCGAKALRAATVKITNGKALARFEGLPPGTYAVGVFHDRNGNGKLDTILGIPREGFGFSRNPPLRPRAPRFEESMMPVREDVRIDIELRYVV